MKKIHILLSLALLGGTSLRAQYGTGDYALSIEVLRVCGYGDNDGNNEEYRWNFHPRLPDGTRIGAGVFAGDEMVPGTCLGEGYTTVYGSNPLPHTIFHHVFNYATERSPSVNLGFDGFEKDCWNSALYFSANCSPRRNNDDDRVNPGNFILAFDAKGEIDNGPRTEYFSNNHPLLQGKYAFELRYTVTPPVLPAPRIVNALSMEEEIPVFCSGDTYRLAVAEPDHEVAAYRWYRSTGAREIIGYEDYVDRECTAELIEKREACKRVCDSGPSPFDCRRRCDEYYRDDLPGCTRQRPIYRTVWEFMTETTGPVSGPITAPQLAAGGDLQVVHGVEAVGRTGLRSIAVGPNSFVVDIYPSAPELRGLPDHRDGVLDPGEGAVSEGTGARIEHVTCLGDATGKIVIKEIDGGRRYSYSLQGIDGDNAHIGINLSDRNAPTPSAPIVLPPTGTGLPAGRYELRIEHYERGKALCFSSDTVTIKEPLDLPSGTASALEYNGGFNVSCNGAGDGIIDISPNGGIGPYTFTLKGSDGFSRTQNSGRFSGLKAMDGTGNAITYSYEVADTYGCTFGSTRAQQLTLKVPDEPEVTGTAALNSYAALGAPEKTYDISCHGGTDSLVLTLSGGVKPYTLSINGQVRALSIGDADVAILPGLGGDIDHEVLISDANQCRRTVNIRLTQPERITLSEKNTTPADCYGTPTASLELKAKGGLVFSGNEYIYRIEHLDVPEDLGFSFEAVRTVTGGSAVFTELIGGGYRVTVSDRFGCSHEETISIDQPTGPNINIGTGPVSCFGEEDGKATAALSGGTPPYQVTWLDGDGSDLKKESDVNGEPINIDGLGAGTYKLSYIDNKGCPFEKQFTIEGPHELVPDLGGGTTICEGSALTLDAGHPGATHQWSSDRGFNSTDQVVTVSGEGTYTVTITDSDGCSGTETFELSTYTEVPEADFLMLSEAMAGDTVVLVNITWPLPRESRWVFPDSVVTVDSSAYHQHLIFPAAGTYTVTLYAGEERCLTEYTKQIVVLEDNGSTSDDVFGPVDERNILGFTVSPNPNNGRFTVDIALKEAGPVRLRLVDINGRTEIREITDRDNRKYTLDYELGPAQRGVHFLILEAGDETAAIRVLVR